MSVSSIIRNKMVLSCGCIFLGLLVFISGLLFGTNFCFPIRHALNKYAVNNSIYRHYVRDHIFKKEVVHANASFIECPTNYKAIAIFGQSNSANRLHRSEGLKSINDGKTFMYDWTTQRCYPYAEPLVGTDGEGMGNIITSTIAGFRKGDTQTNLIVVAFGRGGSSVFSWSHGIESIRLDEVLYRLKKDQINPDLFLWHQGESDAVEEIYFPQKVGAYGMTVGSKKHFYKMSLDIVLQKIHHSFPNALVGVALASICQNKGSQEIRGGQNAMQYKYSWVKISSDTDRFGEKYRSDGCHFNETGEKNIASDYLKLVLSSLDEHKVSV